MLRGTGLAGKIRAFEFDAKATSEEKKRSNGIVYSFLYLALSTGNIKSNKSLVVHAVLLKANMYTSNMKAKVVH